MKLSKMTLRKLRSFVILLIAFFANTLGAFAQEVASNQVDMADTMRSEGKIYVVVVVVAIVFTGLIIYAFNTERKLGKVEKEVKELSSRQNS